MSPKNIWSHFLLATIFALISASYLHAGAVENVVKGVQQLAGQNPESPEAANARNTAKQAVKNQSIDYTPYEKAAAQGGNGASAQQTQVADSPVSVQADVSGSPAPPAPPAKINKDLQNALWRAAEFNKHEIIMELGGLVDVNLPNPNKYGETALYRALIENAFEAGDALIRLGANPNVPNESEEKSLPLSKVRTVKFLYLLLENGADPNLQDARGRTALHNLFFNTFDIKGTENMPQMAQALIDAGGNLSIKDNKGYTPLHAAVYKSYIAGSDEARRDRKIIAKRKNAMASISVLVKAGADINAQDKRGDTPMHLALYWDDYETAEILAQHGPNPHIENNKGISAFEKAAGMNDVKYIRLLK